MYLDDSKVKVDGRELIIIREVDAPVALVFKVFTQAEHLAAWWGPKGWETITFELDFRVGGVWRFCMKCTDERHKNFGQESWGKAVYQGIKESERIDYIDYFTDEKGKPAQGMPEAHVSVTFNEYNGKTKVVLCTEFASEKELQTTLDMGMVQGLEEMWDCLDIYLQKIYSY